MLYSYTNTGASISDCGVYRRALWRWWRKPYKRFVLWVMLNPSTADGLEDDNTVRRCVGYTQRWDFEHDQRLYDGFVIVNLWDFRATDPRRLKLAQVAYNLYFSGDAMNPHPEPLSNENNKAIKSYARRADLIIAAWGAHALGVEGGSSRILAVAGILRKYRDVHALKINADGQPAHPLMLPAILEPKPLWSKHP